MKTWRFVLALAAFALSACGPAKSPDAANSSGASKPALVYAAASLTDVLRNLADAYAATGQPRPDFSFASSSDLARQIEQGARADVFLSADEQWMDYLDSKGLIDKASRVDLLGNTLVLVTPADAPEPKGPLEIEIPAGFDPPKLDPLMLGLGMVLNSSPNAKLAMGDPDAVPAGKYGKEALTSIESWTIMAPRVAKAANVRDALRLVSSGEAAAGIVYATDAKAEPKVKVVAVFPESSHKPIVYPMALVAGRSGGKGFVEFLKSAQAKAAFEAAGFSVK